MTQGDFSSPEAAVPRRVSYALVAGLFILMGWLHLTGLALAVLFSHLALGCLQRLVRRSRWMVVGLFVFLGGAGLYAATIFANQAVHALPEIADKAIPSMVALGRQYHLELPFTDYDTLLGLAADTVKSQVHYLAEFVRLARGAAAQLLLMLAGVVVGVSLFLHPGFELDRPAGSPALNFYSACCDALVERFRLLSQSFALVIGAQVIISAINSLLTAVFAVAVGLPNAGVAIGVTFLCGLLPVVGNLLSNTIIIGIGLTVSPRMALGALVFLVVIHKLEYFLNSKIVGWRTRNPLWLTLLALVLGERLMGIPGMILAPVVLHYLRLETGRLPGGASQRKPAPAQP